MNRSLLEPKSLWSRYVAALALLAACLFVSHAASLMALSGGEEASTAINISGRQRMLSQRILKLTLTEQRSENPERLDPVVTDALDRSLDLFVRSHRALSEGGSMGLTEAGAKTRAPTYEGGTVSLNERVEAFIKDIETARGEEGLARTEALARISDITQTDQLLQALDAAVQTFESQAADGVVRFRQVSWLALGCAFLVLLLEACLIFWPAHRAVSTSYDQLKKQRDALAKSENELKAALASSDEARQSIKNMLHARTAFFAQMSKDLHAPASLLRGYVDQLMTEDFSEHVARRLLLVQRAAEQMDVIIRDVIDMRRIEEGLMVIEEKPLRIDTLVEDVTSRYQGRAARKGLCLEAHFDEQMPRSIIGDSTRLDQVLDNLISNALKFTAEGHITIRTQRIGEDRWQAEVADSGEGMTPEQLETVFHRFEPNANEPGRYGGSTGLGLPICKELATLMGGDLTVESAPGIGTTFHITLPLKSVRADDDQDKDASSEAA